jgi:hypothetical protein
MNELNSTDWYVGQFVCESDVTPADAERAEKHKNPPQKQEQCFYHYLNSFKDAL